MLAALETVGRTTARGVDEVGYAAALCVESVYWFVLGRRERQPVRLSSIVHQMTQIGTCLSLKVIRQ